MSWRSKSQSQRGSQLVIRRELRLNVDLGAIAVIKRFTPRLQVPRYQVEKSRINLATSVILVTHMFQHSKRNQGL